MPITRGRRCCEADWRPGASCKPARRHQLVCWRTAMGRRMADDDIGTTGKVRDKLIERKQDVC
jgi:hypothetical protein